MGRPGIVTPAGVALPEPELVARVLRALADQTRVRLIDVLEHMETATQVELVKRLDLTQSRASEHLRILVWAGFLQEFRDRRTVRYELTDTYAAELLWLTRDFLRSNPEAAGGCPVLEERTGGPDTHWSWRTD